MKKIFFGLGMLLFLAGKGFSQEVQFSGGLSSVAGIYAPGTENAGDFSSGNTDFDCALEVYAGNGTLFLEGDVLYNFLTNSPEFTLSEAYIDYSSSFWGVRVGQQKIVWGKADGISITNSVFPKDSSSLYIDDDVVATKSIRVSYSGNSFTVDVLLIPFFTKTKLPLEEDNPLRNVIVPQKINLDFGGMSFNLPVTIGILETPEINLQNMEYGIKVSGYLSSCDLSFYGFYGWDKTPILSYDVTTVLNPVLGVPVPESLTINGKYKRLGMVGFDAAIPVGAFVLRTETAYFPNREFQSSADAIMGGKDSSIKQHQLMALAGFDWMPSTWTVTAQYYCDVLINKSSDIERTDSYLHGATLSVSKNLLNDLLELSLSGIIGLNNFDSAVSASAEYSLSDQIGISLGTYVFLPGPEKNGTYGEYKDLSSVYVKIEYKW